VTLGGACSVAEGRALDRLDACQLGEVQAEDLRADLIGDLGVAVLLLQLLRDLQRADVIDARLDRDAGPVEAEDDLVRPRPLQRLADQVVALVRRAREPPDDARDADVEIAVLAGHAEQLLVVGPAHMVRDDLQIGEREQHVIEQDGQRVLRRLRHDVRHAHVDRERDAQLARLRVERPHLRVVQRAVLARVDLAELGVVVLDQILQLPDRVLHAPVQDRPDVALEEEPARVRLDLLDDEAVRRHRRREAGHVHHRLPQAEGAQPDHRDDKRRQRQR